jgi:hypothetical protein
MNIHDKLTQVNEQLRSKRPATKTPAPKPATNNLPDTAVLRQRIAQARQNVAATMASAKKLNAHAMIARIRVLSDKLAALEADFGRISGVERRLVRLVNKI